MKRGREGRDTESDMKREKDPELIPSSILHSIHPLNHPNSLPLLFSPN